MISAFMPVSRSVAETVHMYEHRPIGFKVVQVIATDEDAGNNGVVQYEFVTSASSRPDYQYFHINTTTGMITVLQDIDREVHDYLFLEVRAYDLGEPPMDDSQTIQVRVLDIDDHPPTFDRDLYPPPHPVSVLEEMSLVYVANLSLATDPDIGNNSIICYYIVGGDEPYKDRFFMNKTTGELWLVDSIDREIIDEVYLIINATEDCYVGPVDLNQVWNVSDLSTLLVRVDIIDINDNPPRFLRHWLTDGVTKDTQFGEHVIDVSEYATDPDIGNNSLLTYYIEKPFRFSSGLRGEFDEDPFLIDEFDGVIRTNVYFQDDQEGYIEFTVKVNDSNPTHFDKTNVSIYLLNEDQRVKVVIRGEPEEVNLFKDEFAEYMTNVTGVIVNVDQILTHQDSNGDPDPRKTDMFIHGIDPATGRVLDADELIDLIDRNYEALSAMFKRYNVIEIMPAVEKDEGRSVEETVLYGLIAVAGVLLLIILAVIIAFFTCRKKYKRKLKAASAVAYGTNDMGLHSDTPNTNMHSFEGSNPIWLEKYDQGWPRDSDTDSKNSLDENDVSAGPGFKGYDEHERSMEMHNDEFDQYDRAAMGDNQDGDAVLRAALEARKQQNMDPTTRADIISHSSNPVTPSSIRSSAGNRATTTTTTTPENALNGSMSVRSYGYYNSNEQSHSNPAVVGHMNITDPQTRADIFDNRGFELQATEI